MSYSENAGGAMAPFTMPVAPAYGMHGRMPHGSVSTGQYSRHSIGDRVVEKLEKMMDNTDSDYEREELHKFIRMVRQTAD